MSCRQRPESAVASQSIRRSRSRLQRAQPDDDAQYAGHRPGPLIRAARAKTEPAVYSCTKAPFVRSFE